MHEKSICLLKQEFTVNKPERLSKINDNTQDINPIARIFFYNFYGSIFIFCFYS